MSLPLPFCRGETRAHDEYVDFMTYLRKIFELYSLTGERKALSCIEEKRMFNFLIQQWHLWLQYNLLNIQLLLFYFKGTEWWPGTRSPIWVSHMGGTLPSTQAILPCIPEHGNQKAGLETEHLWLEPVLWYTSLALWTKVLPSLLTQTCLNL